MKKKNRAFYRYFIPVIYAVFVYILWELTGTLVAYVVGKVMDNWEETLYSSYISMLFNEVLTFVIMFVLFRKKADGINLCNTMSELDFSDSLCTELDNSEFGEGV